MRVYLLILFCFVSTAAHADCTPANNLVGTKSRVDWVEGGLVYDTTSDVLKTCDGTNWNTVSSGSALSGGTSGYLGVWTSATTLGLSSTTAGQNLFWDATNHRLGIGTATPASMLQLSGTSPRLILTDTDTGANNWIDANSGVGTLAFSADRDNTVANSAMGFSVDGSEAMRIIASGNVGIGTPAPSVKLHVAGGGTTGFYVQDTAGTTRGVQIGSQTSLGVVNYVGGPGDEYRVFNTANGHLTLGTNNAERIRIDASGNVGIGTTTPEATLHVAGTVLGGAGSATDGVLGFGIRYAGVNILNTFGGFYGTGATTLGYGVKPFGGATGYASSNGLTVQRGALMMTDSLIYSNAPSSTTAVGTAITMTERFRIDTSGNVGIGTTTPLAKLQVAGNIRLDSPVNATAGRTVCMNVNGDFHAVSASTCYASDERLKTNIQTLATGQLDRITQLRGVSFEWKNPDEWRPGEQIGLIAQEVEKVYPQVVNTDTKGMKSVDYEWLVSPLVEAVKELKADNDNQAYQIQELRREIEALKAAR